MTTKWPANDHQSPNCVNFDLEYLENDFTDFNDLFCVLLSLLRSITTVCIDFMHNLHMTALHCPIFAILGTKQRHVYNSMQNIIHMTVVELNELSNISKNH